MTCHGNLIKQERCNDDNDREEETRPVEGGALCIFQRSSDPYRDLLECSHPRIEVFFYSGEITMKTCKSCGTELPDEGGIGRPLVYCSTACRRVSEFEIRRLTRALDQLDERARYLRDPTRFHLNAEEEAAFVQAEIVSATERLRELLDDSQA